jgi:hypothetical protein
MELDEGRQMLYASIPDRNEIAFISTRSFTIVTRIVVGSRPHGIALSIDGTRLFVALNEAGSVIELDLDTLEMEEIFVGEYVQDPGIFEVIEARPNQLFVAANPGSSGSSYLAKVVLGFYNNQFLTVGSNQIFRSWPVMKASPDRRFLYVAEPSRIKKLDILNHYAPIILWNPSSLYTGGDLDVHPDGSKIFLRSGIVLDSNTFQKIGQTERGIPRFGDSPDQFYIASEPNLVEIRDSDSLIKTGEFTVSCEFDSIRDFLVMPGDSGWIVLGEDRVCGMVSTPSCQDAPQDPVDPFPMHGTFDVSVSPVLSWQDAGSGCPTTYRVFLGET